MTTVDLNEHLSVRDQMKAVLMSKEGLIPNLSSCNTDDAVELIIDAYNSLNDEHKRYLERYCEIWDFVDSLVGDPLRNTVTFFEGSKGSGKTLSMVAITHHIHEIYDVPIICVGTSLGLNPETYGDFTFLNERQFMDNLQRIAQMEGEISSGESTELIQDLFKQNGVVLNNACLVFDEAYKFFDSRSAMSKMVKAFGYFISMSRHFGSNILIACPRRDMVDRRIREQVDYYAKCFMDQHSGVAIVRLMSEHGLPSKKLTVKLDNYKEMYNTRAIVGLLASHLKLKDL